MQAIQACNPLSTTFLSSPALLLVFEAYDSNEDTISMEAKLATNTLDKKNISNVSSVFLSLIDAFPELFRLIWISMTIVINTTPCARSIQL